MIEDAVETCFLAQESRSGLRGEEDHRKTGPWVRSPTDHPGGLESVELVKRPTVQHLPEVVGDVEGGTKVDVVRLPVVGGDDLLPDDPILYVRHTQTLELLSDLLT